MTINLKEGERLDDLGRKGYRIIQNPATFCFGIDAVLLTGFAKIKPGTKVLDMGTGTGIIPILLEAKTDAEHLTGLEIYSCIGVHHEEHHVSGDAHLYVIVGSGLSAASASSATSSSFLAPFLLSFDVKSPVVVHLF